MQTLTAEILAAWRRAERLEHDYPEGSPQRAAATAACDRLRDLYQELVRSGMATEMTDSEVRERLAAIARGTGQLEAACA